ncbi:MAG: hypothetical protein COA42_18275 [Alteromonadaceae bacterium]|nr:MAG: hypothetical protein COA42_18275 [Alteromonadaceae bacterium]
MSLAKLTHYLNPITAYARQRSPLAFTLGLALALFSAGMQHGDISGLLFLRGWLSMSLLLFLIRLSDDLCDIPVDKLKHPERLLCLPDAPLRQIHIARLALALLLLLLQLPNLQALVFCALSLASFAVFFRLKPKLPTLVHVSLLNASLGLFPLYAALWLHQHIGPAALWMALFFTLGGIAHDLSHSVPDEARPRTPGSHGELEQLKPALLAYLALAAFVLAALAGFQLYRLQLAGLAFASTLGLMLAVVLVLALRLIAKPCEARAKPFYVLGFAFFLLPGLVQVVSVNVLTLFNF